MSDTARASRRGRGGGGAARRAERTAVSVETAKYIERNIPNYEVLTDEALDVIEANAETILAEVGVNYVECPEALERWKAAGAEIEGERVRIPRGLARELIKTAPSTFTQHARNPERSVEIGGNNLVLAPVYGPPFVRDLDGGRRYATLADFEKFVKLGYMSKWLHHSGGTVCEPTDVPVNKRHLDMLLAHMIYSDKPFMGSVTEPSRAQDSVEMCEILFGKEFVQENTVMTSGTRLGCGHIDASLGGSAGRGSLFTACSPWRASDYGRFCHLDRHEFRRADVWHTRGEPHYIRCGTIGTQTWLAVPVSGVFLWVQTARRAGRI